LQGALRTIYVRLAYLLTGSYSTSCVVIQRR
jgi:hypothetical protein